MQSTPPPNMAADGGNHHLTVVVMNFLIIPVTNYSYTTKYPQNKHTQ